MVLRFFQKRRTIAAHRRLEFDYYHLHKAPLRLPNTDSMIAIAILEAEKLSKRSIAVARLNYRSVRA